MRQDVETGWDFERLILETAARCNVAEYGAGDDNRAVIPTDQANLDRVKRAVNRGYKRFLAFDPRWTFLEQPVSIELDPAGTGPRCIDGQSWRYLLPAYVAGPPKGDWRFTDQASGNLVVISSAPQAVARMRDTSPSSTGTPRYAAVRPISRGLGSVQARAEHELIIWPTPDRAYTIEAEFRLRGVELVNLSDRHIAGADHDLTLLDLAVYEFEREDNAAADLPASLLNSQQLDRANRPRRFGSMRSTFQEPTERLPTRRTILIEGQPLQ